MALLFEPKELQHSYLMIKNEELFHGKWPVEKIVLSEVDYEQVFDALRECDHQANPTLKMVVDYSSMSGHWYAAILNWAIHSLGQTDIEIDFLYSVGEHKTNVPPFEISAILPIPGCEGGVGLYRSVSVFGLGFDGLATLCVLDRLEPDDVYCYLASPAAYEDYPGKARGENEELITQYAKATVGLPLSSVEQTTRLLAELIAPHRNRADITFVPMGPKPHVLAAILLALRFEETSCLHVGGLPPAPEEVSPTGQVVATRVSLKRSAAA